MAHEGMQCYWLVASLIFLYSFIGTIIPEGGILFYCDGTIIPRGGTFFYHV
jgi:hypothetical protein